MAKLVLRRQRDCVADIQHEDKCAKTQPTSVFSVVQSSCYFISMGTQTLLTLMQSLFWPLFSWGYTLDQYHFKPSVLCGSPYCYIHTESISILSNTQGIQLFFLVHIHNLTVPGKRLALAPDIHCYWFTTNHPNSSACNNVTTQFISSPSAIWTLWRCDTVHDLLLLLTQCRHHSSAHTLSSLQDFLSFYSSHWQ